MEATFKARPTEYKGVRFRSKSEAIFARALDFFPSLLWEYEPRQWVQPDGWCPDFKAVFKAGGRLQNWAIEYKPGEPTETYLNEAYLRFAAVNFCGPCHAFVVSGSAFDGREFVWREWAKDGWSIRGKDFSFKWHFMEAAKSAISFRFDLVAL